MLLFSRLDEAAPTSDTGGMTRWRLGRRKHARREPLEKPGSGGTDCKLLLVLRSRLSTATRIGMEDML